MLIGAHDGDVHELTGLQAHALTVLDLHQTVDFGRIGVGAPEIDGTVRLLPPEKASRTLKVGEFTRARIVATEGHDLVGVAV